MIVSFWILVALAVCFYISGLAAIAYIVSTQAGGGFMDMSPVLILMGWGLWTFVWVVALAVWGWMR